MSTHYPTITVQPIIKDDAIPAVIALAVEQDPDLLEWMDEHKDDPALVLTECVRVIFGDPDGPNQLIAIDGVTGWTTDLPRTFA